MIYTASALIAYLLGSFCASIPLSKAMCGEDIRTMGSGNAGATNMARSLGMKAGVVTFILDAAKTAAAVYLGYLLCGEAGKAIAGCACIVGHCFPVYFGFRGGKGVSVGAALGMITHPLIFCIVIAVFFAVVKFSRKVSLGSITAAVALPIAALAFRVSGAMLAMCIFSAVLVIFMHRSNIVRLINGTEPDFHPKKSS